jgi:hypothetical protein
MAADDKREYRTFYGFYTTHWFENFGTFANHHYLLVNEYESEGTISVDSSEASITHDFLYPSHIKKKYFIEGRVEGHITLASSECTAHATDYTVEIWKMNENNIPTFLATTGARTIDWTFDWDAGHGVPDPDNGDVVFPYKIDVSQEKEIGENDRLFVRVKVTCDRCTHLMHSNDSSWEDLKLDIPFKL